MFATAPGREDLPAVRRFRTTAAARVRVAYLTNGDATPPGSRLLFPNQVAAALRESAASACDTLGADHVFLNLPHIDGLADLSTLQSIWPADTLRAVLRREMVDFQPDLVLLNGIERHDVPASVSFALESALKEAIESLRQARRWAPKSAARSVLTRERQRWRSADEVLVRAEGAYAAWREAVPSTNIAYRPVAGSQDPKPSIVADPASLLRRTKTGVVAGLDSTIRAFGSRAARWRRLPSGAAQTRALKEAVQILAQIDRSLVGTLWGSDEVRRTLLDWRGALEDIRLALLGVRAYWSVTESVLTNLQLTTLTVDSVRGTVGGVGTTIFFPMVQKGWIVNEDVSSQHPLSFGEPYRILSPRTITFDLSRDLHGLEQRRWRTPWYFFIVHQSERPERNFSLRLDAGFLGAPRFAVDVLTPIVMASPGERLVLRLTNHSRDGVRDSVAAIGRTVRSAAMYFRMNFKGSTEVDTLSLDFDPSLPDGSTIAEVGIGGDPVGRFVVRRFPVPIDSTSVVGVIGGLTETVTGTAVRRLGYKARSIDPARVTDQQLAGLSTVVVPEWAGGLLSADGWKSLERHARSGGRLVVMAQYAPVAVRIPGVPIRTMEVDGSTDSTSTLAFSSATRLADAPNDMSGESWEGWLNRKVTHRLTLDTASANVLATVGPNRLPAIVRWPLERGEVTYVNLNLHHQFLNVLPASYRLLSNLLAP